MTLKRFNLIFCLFFILVVGQVQAQSTHGYRCPPAMSIFRGELDPVFPQGETESGAARYIYSEFYPIGWSKKGHLAFIEMQAQDPESGENGTFRFRIINTNSGESSFRIILNSNDKRMSLQDAWYRNLPIIEKKLARFGVIQSDDFEMRAFPYQMPDGKLVKLKGEIIQLDTTQKVWDPWIQNPECLLEFTLSKAHQSKTLISTGAYCHYEEGRDWSRLTPMGFIKSPYSDHVMVIFAFRMRPACGGPPMPVVLTGFTMDLEYF